MGLSEPFIGEIRMVGFNYAPIGWARCDGQLLPLDQHTTLFSLLGTIYGGDGRTTFGLPDLRGRIAMHNGQGPGLTSHPIGQRAGAESTTLTAAQIPVHAHIATMNTSSQEGTSAIPAGNLLAKSDGGEYTDQAADSQLAAGAISVGSAGGGMSHTNMQPHLAVNFIIALEGIYPPRP